MPTCPPEIIQTINQLSEFDNELRKLTAVRIRDSVHGYFESPYFFRGQPGQEEIIATLFRDRLTQVDGAMTEIYRALKEEYVEICKWVSRANKTGLQFNFDIWNYLKYDEVIAATFVREKNFLEPHYPVMSLARHHGCKNRLIDFTKDGHTGLFFALLSAFEKIEHQFFLFCNERESLTDENSALFQEWLGTRCARVWAIEEKTLRNSDVIFPDYGNNKFAHAQMAAFILAPTTVTGMADFSWGKLIFSNNFDYYGFECKKVFDIPYRSVPDILLEMERYALNHIKYFPTFDSVTQNNWFLQRLARMHNQFLHLRSMA